MKMPPMPKRNVSVIIVDLKMDRTKAKRILEKIIVYMNLLQKKDETSLILLNSQKSTHKRYNHVEVVCKNESFDLEMLEDLDSCGTADGNWLHAVKVATDILKTYYDVKNIFTWQMIFITDLKTEIATNSEDATKDVIEDFRLNEIFFYVVGVDVKWTHEIEDFDDVSEAMKEVEARSVDGNSFEIMKDFVMEVEGIMCREDQVHTALRFYVNEIPKQPWLQPLTIENFTFPTITSKILDLGVFSNIKKANIYIKKPKVYVTRPEDDETSPVTVPVDATTRAFLFLDKVITLPKDVQESFKYKGNRMFKLLGFVKRDDFQEIYCIGGECHLVQPDTAKPRHKLFLDLVKETERTNKLGLAIRSYNNNNKPRLYVLVPEYPNFIMVPHSRIIKETSRVKPPVPKPSEANPEKLAAFSSYLKDIGDRPSEFAPDCDAGVFFPKYVDNVRMITLGAQIEIEELEENNEKLVELERVCLAEEEVAAKVEQMDVAGDDEDW